MSSNRLPKGNWRLDPFTRVVRYVVDPPKVPRTLSPCGTPAAYFRHARHGEQPCDPCKRANAQYRAANRQKRAAA